MLSLERALCRGKTMYKISTIIQETSEERSTADVHGFCRLCASKVPRNKLVDLRNDVAKYDVINTELTRLNTTLDFNKLGMPTTVCYECCSALHDAYEFVMAVHRAQTVLNNLTHTHGPIKCDQVRAINYERTSDKDASPPQERGKTIGKKLNIKTTKIKILVGNSVKYVKLLPLPPGVRPVLVTQIPTMKNTSNILNPLANPIRLFQYDGNMKSMPSYTKSISSTSNTLSLIDNKDNVPEFPQDPDIKVEQVDLNESNDELQGTDTDQCSVATMPSNSTDNEARVTHGSKSWRDYEWKCSICEAPFPTCGELISHSMLEHNRCNTFKCLDCNKRSSTLNNLVKHVKRKHWPDLKQSCYKCFQRLNSQADKIKHLKTHVHTPFTCKGCNTCFKDLNEVEKHKSKFYKDLYTPYAERLRPFEGKFKGLTCLLCNKTLSGIFSLYSHLINHFAEKNNFICDKCGKGYKQRDYILHHMKTHNEARPFKCKICSTAFKFKSDLKHHVAVHSKEKIFTCDICENKFSTKRLLGEHKKRHSKSNSVICEVCKKSFRCKKYLTRHMKQHTGEKPYYCDACDHHFTYWPNYNKHMTKIHGMNMSKAKCTKILDEKLEEWMNQTLKLEKRPSKKTSDPNIKE